MALLIDDSSSAVIRLAIYLLLALAFVIGALQLHRLVALGQESAFGWLKTPGQRHRTRHYLRNLLIVAGIATLSTVPLAVISADEAKNPHTSWHAGILFFVLLSLWSYLFTRFSLLFVARAVDEPLTLRLSWRVTAQFPKLVVCLALMIPMLVLLDLFIVESVVTSAGCVGLCESLVNKFVFAACLSLFVVSLTLAYEYMRENSPFFLATENNH